MSAPITHDSDGRYIEFGFNVDGLRSIIHSAHHFDSGTALLLAIIRASGKPLSVQELVDLTGQDVMDVRDSLLELIRKHRANWRLISGSDLLKYTVVAVSL